MALQRPQQGVVALGHAKAPHQALCRPSTRRMGKPQGKLDHATCPGVFVSLEDAGAEVRLRVANDGRIDDEMLPSIFEPFHGRASGARTRGRGLGLGLYITRQIAAAHGGRLELEHGPGERLTFTVTLPRAVA